MLLKPAPDAQQAGCWQRTVFSDLEEQGEVYGLLQRIRALKHLALLNNAVHKEPIDCSYSVGEYEAGCGLQVPAFSKLPESCAATQHLPIASDAGSVEVVCTARRIMPKRISKRTACWSTTR